jgi:UDP-N-acetylmuramoyl-L-alanyl-D-glutamate--2,6-diaminopimelate ligase
MPEHGQDGGRIVNGRLPLPAPPVLIAGLGRAGEAALGLLTRVFGSNGISAWDASESGSVRTRAARWRARGVSVTLGGDGRDALRALKSPSAIIKSPGIDMDVPLLRAAAEQGVQVLDELEIGWRAYDRPLVAVTGTNGKSTTCSLVSSVLSAAGHSTQLAGNTEFGPPLSGADAKASVVCEVSSFQLQAAPTFLPQFAIFTNLSLEHLPRHGTMEAYGDAKQLMFVRGDRTCGTAIVNSDDALGGRILAALRRANGLTLSYGFASGADIRILDARWSMREAKVTLAVDGRELTLRSRLPGRHNALNIAAAFAYGRAAGIAEASVVTGIASTVAPPGRFQLIDEGQPFDVVVDYAHTPDGIAQFLTAARAVTAARKSALRTVFGAVGLPDAPKARGCGAAAAALSDHLILTTGSAPHSSRVLRLCELRRAAQSAARLELVIDRRRAIQHAIASALPGDVVAILGLGALGRMILDAKGTISAFDDREVARNLLRSP